MQSENKKRAPAWTTEELKDLVAIWGEDSVLSELRLSKRNEKVFERISRCMLARGHIRDSMQCRVKVKELRQAYQKAREANGRSGVAPKTCRFYAELNAILGGLPTSSPPLTVDSEDQIAVSTMAEDNAEGEDKEDVPADETAESMHLSINSSSQDLFLTQDLSLQQAAPPNVTESDPMEGISDMQCSNPSTTVRKSKRKRRTREEFFSEMIELNKTGQAKHDSFIQVLEKYKKEANEREERRDARDERWRHEEDNLRKEVRQEFNRCREEDSRWREGTLELLRDHTDILRRFVFFHEQLHGSRLPMQSMNTQPAISHSSISPLSRRRVRVRGGRITDTAQSSPMGRGKQMQ